MPVSNTTPINTYVGDNSTAAFAYTFRILDEGDLSVYLDGVVQGSGFTVTGVDEDAGGTVTFTSPPATSVVVRLQRQVTINRETDYTEGGRLSSQTLDDDFDRIVMQVQDLDLITLQEASDGKWDAESLVIKNVSDPTNAQDAVTKTWAETSMSSQLASAISAANTSTANVALTAADVSTTNANVALTAADVSTTNANVALTAADVVSTNADVSTTNANVALTAADVVSTNADVSTTNANVALTAADVVTVAGIYDNFDDRYLGSKTVEPTLDNDGDALSAGVLYYNTTTGNMKVYTGSIWDDAYANLTGLLLDTNNLSDLDNATTARMNLGVAIGTDVQEYDAGLNDIAGLAVTDGNIIVGDGTNWVAESGATARTSLGLTIGTDVQAYDADTAKLDVIQTFTAAQNINALTVKEVNETVYNVTGTTPALDPANGTIQYWTLTAASTPTSSLSSGQSMTLLINDGTAYTITWPTMQWIGGAAPTLATSGYTAVTLFNISGGLYGVGVGDFS